MSEAWVPCCITKPHVAHRPYYRDDPCPGIPYEDERFRYAEDLARRLLPPHRRPSRPLP